MIHRAGVKMSPMLMYRIFWNISRIVFMIWNVQWLIYSKAKHNINIKNAMHTHSIGSSVANLIWQPIHHQIKMQLTKLKIISLNWNSQLYSMSAWWPPHQKFTKFYKTNLNLSICHFTFCSTEVIPLDYTGNLVSLPKSSHSWPSAGHFFSPSKWR